MKLQTALLAVVLMAQAAPRPTMGDVAFRKGDFDAAKAAYAAAVAESPNDFDALLGLGTVDLYHGDVDGARRALHLAARLKPSDPIVARRLREIRELDGMPGDFAIDMQAPVVTLPFVVTDPLPMIRATINGKDALLVLDTGGRTIDLSAAAARRMHVAMHPSGEGVFAGGRRAPVFAGRVESVSFPGLTVHGVPVGEMPSAMPAILAGRAYDGIIGTTFLRRFLSTLDYRDGRLVLRPRADSANMEAKAVKSGAAVVPFWLVPDHFIFVRARVNERFEGLFNLDTGGAGIGIALTKDALAAAAIALDPKKALSGIGGGGEVRLIPYTVASASLGAFTRKNVPGVYSPMGDPYGGFPFTVAGALSHGFFRTSAVTFDFDAMNVIVAANHS